MGRLFDGLAEGLLLLECAQNIELTILHLVGLKGGFNDMFDVNMWFEVGIFINNYFDRLLIYLTIQEKSLECW